MTTTFYQPYLDTLYNDYCNGSWSTWCPTILFYYNSYVKNILSQFGFGIAVGLYFVGMSMILVVWDWLPLSFRLLFMGKAADYDWDEPYTY